MRRWNVDLTYEHPEAPKMVAKISVEEIEELQEIVEAGPTWEYLTEVKITYNNKSGNYQTVNEYYDEISRWHAWLNDEEIADGVCVQYETGVK